jgi:hypothetical protein
VIAQSADLGQSEYKIKGACSPVGRTSGPMGRRFGRASDPALMAPYDTAFALNKDGSQVRPGLSVAYVEGECATRQQADRYYTFIAQLNESMSSSKTGLWILYYEGEPTREGCKLVYRDHKCKYGVSCD